MKGDFRQEASKDQHWCELFPVPHGNPISLLTRVWGTNMRDAWRWPEDVSLSTKAIIPVAEKKLATL